MADSSDRRTLRRRLFGAATAFLVVFLLGVSGFVWLGDGRWSAEDAAYMVVITLSTVGYAETLSGMAHVPGARFFNILLILCGTGTMLFLTSSITAFVVEGDLRGYLRKRAMQREIQELSGHYLLCGLGGVGSAILGAIEAHGSRVVVVERTPTKLTDQTCPRVIGDATDEGVLLDAGIERAAGLVASLSDDRDNLFLVFTARSMFPNLRIVAKVVDPGNESKMRRAGADEVVSPASMGGLRMATALLQPTLAAYMEALGHGSEDPHVIEEITVSDEAPAVGHTIGALDIRSHRNTLVLALRRGDGRYLHNPGPDATVSAGDTLIVLVATDVRDALRLALAGHH